MTGSHPHNLFRIPERLDFHDEAVALITLVEVFYLMPLRDDKPGIFYTDHRDLLGGAIGPGEDPGMAFHRELAKELSLRAGRLRYFNPYDFDRTVAGGLRRIYYELTSPASDQPTLRLGEGRLMQLLPPDMLLNKRLVPYDSFAVWLHLASRRLASGATPDRDQRERDEI